jgi:DNA-binding CsgD family transcriptional regulator
VNLWITITYISERKNVETALVELHTNMEQREREALLLVGDGCTSKKNAERLGIRINTVEVHRANLMRKLDATNAASLSNWALAAEQMTASATSCPS